MPTNAIKHNQLRLAKKLAGIQVSSEIERDTKINRTLKEHPEFEASQFKKMVKDFQIRQNSGENEE